ncbi:hypothetical protein acdb102_16830 [Acidothermaceae bacterium B102]|nr:hypothetical protein acdb102_16830 [Acidothermaceae bacterium B102]
MCSETPAATLDLPATTEAPRLGREFVHFALCAAHHATVRDDAELLVSELVTNAVLHGLPPITLRVDCDTLELIVEVSDEAAGPALAPRDVTLEGESGRGLALVDILSDAWGVEPLDQGKVVWFRLRP